MLKHQDWTRDCASVGGIWWCWVRREETLVRTSAGVADGFGEFGIRGGGGHFWISGNGGLSRNECGR